MAEPSKLVVLPERRGPDFEIDDEQVLEVACQLLGAEPPEGEEYEHENVEFWNAVGMAAPGIAANSPKVAANLAGAAAGGAAAHAIFDFLGDLASEDPTDRWEKVQANQDLVVPLVRGLLTVQIETEGRQGDLAVRRPDSPRLDEVECSTDTFRPLVVYRVHPMREDYYVPLANFHPQMLHDRKGEFYRIAANLGAKEIRIVSSEERRTSAGVEGELEEPTGMADGGPEAGGYSAEKKMFDLSASFAEPNEPPSEPENTHWLQQEPMWQAMVETRLEQWVTKFRVNFSYLSDFGVNADIAASLKGFGLKLGGEYQHKEEYDREYEVEFWPKSAY
jgi:hypothetical protein